MTVSARSLVQRRLLLEVSAAGVDQVGVSVEQPAKLVAPFTTTVPLDTLGTSSDERAGARPAFRAEICSAKSA
jgi:hypothetical protein